MTFPCAQISLWIRRWSPSTSDSSLVCAPPSASSATKSDTPDLAEIEKLMKTEVQEENPLPSKETIEQKQAGKL